MLPTSSKTAVHCALEELERLRRSAEESRKEILTLRATMDEMTATSLALMAGVDRILARR